ncbi:MAG: ABC transporter ATP-binding protein [Acidobacteriota bacterium]|nr:ABC transporter ATP-binding protein [Acidobacteriota bacterium]
MPSTRSAIPPYVPPGEGAVPDALLEVEALSIDYVTDAGDVHAVDDVSFSVQAGEFVGIVGESGCGKSTMLFGIAQLLSPPGELTAGRVLFRGTDMVRLSAGELRHMRWRDYSVVMQSAMNALNPMKSIGAQFKDTLQAHERMSGERIRERSAEVLTLVGIDPAHLKSFPHQLSGGMRQRAMIAMALLFTPQLVVMDEPTSALDVVAQRALMLKIRELQERLGFAVIFVTHDMHVVSRYSDRVLVMYAGQIVEAAATAQMFEHPQHPYSHGLIEAFPTVSGPRRQLIGIPGSPPDLTQPIRGCRFRPRCPVAMEICAVKAPELYESGPALVRCLLYTDWEAEARASADGAADDA